MSLVDIYEKISGILGWSPRILIKNALDSIEKIIESKTGGVVMLKAPTGYGKSLLSLTLYVAMKQYGRNDLGFRIIHVLPLRSIGDKIYRDLVRHGGYISRLKNSGLSRLLEEDIGLQHMSVHGSPFLSRRYVITTIDTFSMALFKIPPQEFRKIVRYGTAHYEIPRGFIYASTVVLDEFHLYAQASSGLKMLETSIVALKHLIMAGAPVLLATATMPKWVEKLVEEEIKNIGSEIIKISGEPTDAPKRRLSIYFLDGDVEAIAREACSRAREGSVLVISNTVSNAIRIYDNIKKECVEEETLLLHAKMSGGHRARVLERISDWERNGEIDRGILVSTQVVEAGVDLSFNTLITEECPPDSLIQRAGRVARRGGEGTVIIYPFKSEESSWVYDEEIVKRTTKTLRECNALCEDRLMNILDEYGEHLIKAHRMDSSLIRLREILSEMDRNISLGSKDAVEVIIKDMCSITRDTELIPVITRDMINPLVNGKASLQDLFIPLDTRILEKLYKSNKLKGLLKGRSIETSEKISKIIKQDACISIEMMREGVEAIVLDLDYDNEKGLVL